MTFYLKYRPQTLAELDLTNVRESLEKIVASGKIPHALLFSGPKGLGKTSAARILAKAVNCEKIVTGDKRQTAGFEPCNKCGQCLSITKGTNLDVIELDAASHRGIDDIRILRDAVKLAPATARKKVYIIDEAHMLTTEAVNALLKTLEEPPSHVMFVLATTNPEKLIGTIRSRVTEIPFKKATIEETLRSLARVVAGEKIKIEKGALEEIAKKAAGSLRDATKILEQLVIEDRNFDAKSVAEFLFRAQTFDLDNFLVLLAKKDVKAAILEIENVSRSGLETELLVKSLLERFRLSLLAKVGVGEDSLEFFNKDEIMELIDLFSEAGREVKTALIEELPVEIAVVRWGRGELEVQSSRHSPGQAKLKTDEEKKPGKSDKRSTGLSRFSAAISTHLEDRNGNGDLKASMEFTKEISEETWKKILLQMKGKNTTVEALLRAARPVGFDGKVLTLGVYYKFHKERLEDGRYRKILEGICAEVLGNGIRVACTLTEPPVREVIKPKEAASATATVLTEGKDSDIIKVAEEIFGN